MPLITEKLQEDNINLDKLIVYYDGACQKCIRDRENYEKLSGQSGEQVCWFDITGQENRLTVDREKETLFDDISYLFQERAANSGRRFTFARQQSAALAKADKIGQKSQANQLAFDASYCSQTLFYSTTPLGFTYLIKW